MSIEKRRAEIDAIDEELLRLLNMRAQLAVRVGETKREAGLSILDSERESEIIERARRINTGPLAESAVVKLFKCIIRESRLAEERALGQPHYEQNRTRR